MAQTGNSGYIPALMTSGSLHPLPATVPTARSASPQPPPASGDSTTHSSLTTSHEDIATAVRSSDDTLIATSAVLHRELADFDIGAACIIRRGAVLRPPVCVYINQAASAAPPRVEIGAFTYIGPEVVCEAAEVGQLVRMEEQCVVAVGVHIPDGVWLLAKTWVPAEAVLAPYTVYRGVPARPTLKMNARVYQMEQLEFLRELRSLAGQEKEENTE